MSRTLVVVAHPELDSSRINAAWMRALDGLHSATVHNLYGSYPDAKIDVRHEQRLMDAHDRIVLQFPFQWYNCPALLKQWLDKVLESGWAYGPSGHALEGKTMSLAVSTWSIAQDYQRDGRYGRSIEDLLSPFEVTALRVGMRFQPGFYLHGIGEISDEQLVLNARAYREFINQH